MRKLIKTKTIKKSKKSGSTKFPQNVGRKETGKEESAVWDLGSPLYDSHEVVSVGNLIDRHLMVLPLSLGSGGSKRLSRKFSSSGRSHVVVVPAPPSPTRSTGGRENGDVVAVGGGVSTDNRRPVVGGAFGFVGRKLRKRNENKKKKKIGRRSGKEGKQQRSAKGKKSVGLIIACFGRKKR